MGDPTSAYIFSIDPAVVNIGVCLYDYGKGEVLFADRLQIAPSMKALGPDDQIVPKIFKLFFDDKNSPYAHMIRSSKIVVIESQMKVKMKIIQHVIASFCFAANLEYKMIAPQLVKTHFDTGARGRAKTGKTVKGKTNNYNCNKKMAIQKAIEIHPTIFTTCAKSKQDDIADSLLQAVYYGDKLTGTKRTTVTNNLVMGTKKRKGSATKAAPVKKRKRVGTSKK
jgi:hypothetical protein